MIKIKKECFREDIENYFAKSGIREYKKLNHSPFIVLTEIEDHISVEIVTSADDLIEYPDNTEVIGQWKGQYSSDFFSFRVIDFKEYIKNNPKKDYYIV